MSAAGLIFRKELKELVRDKRTFYSAIVGPVLLIFLTVYSINLLEKSFREPKSQKLHVVRSEASRDFVARLRAIEELNVIEVASLQEGRRLIESGGARAVLDFDPGGAGKPLTMRIVYEEEDIKGKVMAGVLEEVVAKTNDLKLHALLDQAGVPESDRIAATLKREPIASKEAGAAATLAGFLPYLIVIWAFYGAFGSASESVAGEKEKQTLETLLITPVSRRDIALGKFYSLTAIALTSSVISILTIVVLGMTMRSRELFPNGFQMPAANLLAMAGVLVPLAAMFAALLLAISAFSRNTRECQTYLTMVSFVVLIPAMFSQFIGFTDFAKASWVSFVPVLNSATVLKQALLGRIDGFALAATIGMSVALAAAAILWAVRLFQREQVLVRV